MRWRALAIVMLLTAAMAAFAGSAQTDYSGAAKIVLKLEKMPDQPAMPENPAKTGGLVATTFGFPVIVQNGSTSAFNTPQAPEAPAVPQGTLLQATVIYSSDPAFKANDTCMLRVEYDPDSMPYGLKANLLDNLNPGAVVGINSYTADGSTITVDAGTALWERKIFILDSGSRSARQNPFRMDLSFRQFKEFPAFSTQNQPFPAIDFSGLFSHLFD